MARAVQWWRRVPVLAGLMVLIATCCVCVCSLPWTLGEVSQGERSGIARYNEGDAKSGRLPPLWWSPTRAQALRFNAAVDAAAVETIARECGVSAAEARGATEGQLGARMREKWPRYLLGTDVLGRSLLIRILTGGGISLGIGIAAALISVVIGTLYGATAGYLGGRVDELMMRAVDVLYGLPYVLLVVLLAVAVDAGMDRAMVMRVKAAAEQRKVYVETEMSKFAPDQQQDPVLRRQIEEEAGKQFAAGEVSGVSRGMLNVVTLLIAIGGVSWLTMARVIRGQVLSLKQQPFIEAARAIGLSPLRVFFRHLLPNLTGPIIVYATLTVPQAILQESFLSFLGIGVKPPLPSWGNLAAEGLGELNPYESHWWLLVFPCLLLGMTLLAMNLVGEGLREAMDPRSVRR